jgi:hypothetical protein
LEDNVSPRKLEFGILLKPKFALGVVDYSFRERHIYSFGWKNCEVISQVGIFIRKIK